MSRGSNKRISFIFLIIILLTSLVVVQANTASINEKDIPKEIWTKVLAETEGLNPHALITTSDGGYAITGETNELDIMLVKINMNGKVEWSQKYIESDSAWALTLIQTSDGGYAIGGSTGGDMVLIKADSEGETQWINTYGGEKSQLAYDLIQTTDGGFALIGYTIGNETDFWGDTNKDIWFVKTDTDGNLEWNQSYERPYFSDEIGFSLVQNYDKSFVLIGIIFGQYSSAMWLIKTDTNGVAQWNRSYSGLVDLNRQPEVLQATDGDIVFAGNTWHPGGGLDLFLGKVNLEGENLWNQTYYFKREGEGTYGGIRDSDFIAFVQTSDEGYVLLANSYRIYGNSGASVNAAGGPLWLVKTDKNGIHQWNQTYGDAKAIDMIQNSDGDLIITGIENEGVYLLKIGTSSSSIPSLDFLSIIIVLTLFIKWKTRKKKG